MGWVVTEDASDVSTGSGSGWLRWSLHFLVRRGLQTGQRGVEDYSSDIYGCVGKPQEHSDV